MSIVRVELARIGPCAFEAVNAEGARVRTQGSPALEAKILERVADPATIPRAPEARPMDTGMRPMELFLVSLASCAAMDVVLILTRQRQDLRGLHIIAQGHRADATPAVYEHITVRFEASEDVDPGKLTRAAELSVRKYCSVASMLGNDVTLLVETDTFTTG